VKVLYVVGTLEVGGLERFVTNVSLRAKKSGAYEPLVLCVNEKRGPFLEVLENMGVTIIEAPHRWSRNFKDLFGLSRQIRCLAPDIVHSQVNFSMGQQRLAVLLANPGIKFCVTERNEYPLEGFAKTRRKMQYYLLKLFITNYSANSVSGAEYLAKQVGTSPQNINVIPNGVPSIQKDALIRKKMRRSLGWEEGDFGIGYISRMASHKGHDLFVNSVSELFKLGHPVKSCLLGDGPCKTHLETVVRNLGLKDNILMPGRVTNVEDYLQAFDAVVLLSEREGMPNALLEAMAAGKAVVATPVGGIPEILGYGKAGILVEPEITPIVNALGTLINDRDLCRKYGSKAKQQVLNNYSIDSMFDKLLLLYKDVMD